MEAVVMTIIEQDVQRIAESLGDKVQDLAGSTLMLTGALGFLGGYFLNVFHELNKSVLKKPMKVLALDNQVVTNTERVQHILDDEHFTFIAHDITKPVENIAELDYVIHAACIASPIFYRQYPLETIDANVNGTWRLLELAKAKNVKSFLFYSSSEIYGNPTADAIPTPETYWGNVSSTGPRACYDESKRVGETLCINFHAQHKLPVKIIRPFNVFGPGQRLDDQRIVPDLMNAALNKQPIALFSDGTPTRSFCYISDFLAGTLHVLLSDKDGEIFNVGNDQEISMKEVAEQVAELVDPPLPVEFQKSKDAKYLEDNPDRRCPDLTKMKTTFPWKPVVSLKDGLSYTLQSYQQSA